MTLFVFYGREELSRISKISCRFSPCLHDGVFTDGWDCSVWAFVCDITSVCACKYSTYLYHSRQYTSSFALVCKALHSTPFILFKRQKSSRTRRARAQEVWAAVTRLAPSIVYPVCIVWDYTCQGTVNKDSVHLLHAVLDPAAKSWYEWEHVWIRTFVSNSST